MSRFRPAATNYIPVLDLAAAAAWYSDKFGLRQYTIKFDDSQRGLELKAANEIFFVLGPSGVPAKAETPMLYASDIERARKYLTARGVEIGDVQKNRQGTTFFEIRDPEGHIIEICEEP